MSVILKVMCKMDTRTEIEQKSDFLCAYMDTYHIGRSAQIARIGINKVGKWRQLDAEFKEAFEEIVLAQCAELEAEAYRRAVTGTDEPVIQRGQEVGKIRRYSDSLLIFLMKGMMPDKYRDKLIADPKRGSGTVLVLPENGREITDIETESDT